MIVYTTSIRHDTTTEKFKIGGSNLELVGKDVKVDGVTYTGTPALYELLFKKEPKGYKNSYLDSYMDILNRSHVYRRNNNPNVSVTLYCYSFVND